PPLAFAVANGNRGSFTTNERTAHGPNLSPSRQEVPGSRVAITGKAGSRLAFPVWHAPCCCRVWAMGQRRILVVEDKAALRDVLADFLASDGHQADTACDGLEALDWLDQHHYDAVFTDLHMPGLDGPSLYEAIRQRQGEDPPRIIFMTGNAALSA